MLLTYLLLLDHHKWNVRWYTDALSAVRQLHLSVPQHPVHAQFLRLLRLSWRVVRRYAAKNGMINAEAGRQLAADVRLTMRQSTAHGAGQMTVVIQQTCIQQLNSDSTSQSTQKMLSFQRRSSEPIT